MNIPGGAGRRGPRPREGAGARRQRRRLARHPRGDGKAVRAEAGHFMKKRNSYFSLNSHVKKTTCNPREAGEQGARAAGPGAEPGLRDPHPAEAEPPLHPQAARGYGWPNSGLGRSFL